MRTLYRYDGYLVITINPSNDQVFFSPARCAGSVSGSVGGREHARVSDCSCEPDLNRIRDTFPRLSLYVVRFKGLSPVAVAGLFVLFR